MMLIHYEWPLFLSPIRAIIFDYMKWLNTTANDDPLTCISSLRIACFWLFSNFKDKALFDQDFSSSALAGL